jgi:ADP-heptose:LPS heptosyltransferase
LFGSGALTKRGHPGAGADRQVAAHLIKRANTARDSRDWSRAALLYEEALQLVPDRADLHVQRGHMLKESGALDAAEQAYLAASALIPHDADLALQFGHLYKIADRLDEARSAYERALQLKPGWDLPRRELDQLLQIADQQLRGRIHGGFDPPNPGATLAQAAALLADPAAMARLVPELAPRGATAFLEMPSQKLELNRMGRHEPGFWGRKRTLRGVEAIRGSCISAVPIQEVQLLLDGAVFYRGQLRGPYPVGDGAGGDQKYVFNLWHDFASFAPGRHAFELRVVDVEQDVQSFHDDIVIAPPLNIADFSQSDALIPISDADPVSLERQIRSAASVIRSARRDIFPQRPRNILVLRTDQLGDLVASIAALRRLRELFPQARILGLFTAANAELATTLGLLDEIIVVDFPDDALEHRRVMPLEQQEQLRSQLAPFHFDLAIDLAQSSVSRDLLRLSGAPFLYGDEEGDFDWLTASFSVRSRDRLNRLDFVPHSRKTLALVETLGALARDSFEVIRRPDLTRDRLKRFGISATDDYAVLHMGARISFSRWPGFMELTALMLAETALKIVLMTDDPDTRAMLPPELAASDRFQLIDERLTFDDFDAFLSFARVVVGNDSGPKHLASLRGTRVVTVHTARINWNDWGQEQVGTIISRRVPCAGCNIFHNKEECGKDFACIRDIRPTEVFDAVKAQLKDLPCS